MLIVLFGYEYYVFFFQIVWVLMICLDFFFLGQIILFRYFNDILVVLLQFVYGKQTVVDKNKIFLEICLGVDYREEKGIVKESGSLGFGSLIFVFVVDMVI